MHQFEYELTRKTNPTTLKHGNQMISANDRMHFRVKSQITQFLRKLMINGNMRYIHVKIHAPLPLMCNHQHLGEWMRQIGIPQ